MPTVVKPNLSQAYAALMEILPELLKIGWVNSLCTSEDDTLLLDAQLEDGRKIKLEIEDSKTMGSARPGGIYTDETSASILAWLKET